MLFNILLFTFGASILSLILVGALLLHRTLIKKISFSLVSFAAGALLATGFLDTMREAVKMAGEEVFLWVTISFSAFFIIERAFLALHHHDHVQTEAESLRLPAGLLIFGDSLHNFIDGVSIAATFLVSFPLGLITSIAVFVHEIPHELGDFGILIHKGWGRSKVLYFNFATGMTSILGAVLTFYFGSIFKDSIPLLLAITSGNFIYLSATDLLPEIHHRSHEKSSFNHTFFFFLGIFLIAVLTKVTGEI